MICKPNDHRFRDVELMPFMIVGGGQKAQKGGGKN
jgi:hypothetical protein